MCRIREDKNQRDALKTDIHSSCLREPDKREGGTNILYVQQVMCSTKNEGERGEYRP
jgi:hypothetical protein